MESLWMFLLPAKEFPKKHLETEPYKYQIWMETLVLGLKSIWGSAWGPDLEVDCSGCGFAI